MYLDSYNNNTYVKCLKELNEGLSRINSFLSRIEANAHIRDIEEIIELYSSIFNSPLLKDHFLFKTQRIYKPLYLSDPGPYTKANSYWHISIKPTSEIIKWLDEVYELQITRLLRFFKHAFSRINNFFINLDKTALQKFKTLFSQIKNETQTFLQYVDHRALLEKKDKLDEDKLLKIPFGGLFYTAHLKNLKSILSLGILSHNSAHSRGLVDEDISNRQVNDRRNRMVQAVGGNIHDFSPLYFNPRNPMLYYLCKQKRKEDLVLLRVNPHILLEQNVCFSDGNAAASATRFYNNLSEFNQLNWEIIRNEYWTNYPDGKRIKCAEVLVKEKVPLEYITNIYVYNENALSQILSIFPNHLGINTSINSKLYF